ncbi:MAG: oligosaccharide flippase family protein [Chitinophagales bacterium]|nr:oligosaccharide flippase family protein [Chitinophagales bacterium]
MSEIRKQGIANAAISFIGIGLGYLYTGLLGPYIFTPEQIGLTSTLMAVALITSHLSRFGAPYMAIKFFPQFSGSARERQSLHNFLFLLTTLGFFVFLIAYLFFQPQIVSVFGKRSPLFASYNRMAIIMVAFMSLFELYMAYSRALLRTVMPAFLRDILWRLIVIAGMLAYYFGYISFDAFVYIYACGFALPTLVLVLYLFYFKELGTQTHIDLKGNRTEIFKYGRYVFIGTLTTITINEVDKLMISGLIGEGYTGIYQVAAFFSQVLLVPSRAILTVAAPLLAGFLLNNEIEKVERIYKKSSINQLVVGLFLFVGIYINLHNIFRILPPEYAQGSSVIIFLSLAKLFDLATGVNGEIILNSKYFRFDLYFNLSLLLLIIATDYIVIPIYGITGAAMASAAIILLYNGAKSFFLWRVYHIQPFSAKTLVIIAIALIAIGINLLLPVLDSLLLDIAYRSAIMSILFIGLTIWWKVSGDMNEVFSKVIMRIKT